jgi:aminoglycoside 3-N-acetyltransferase
MDNEKAPIITRSGLIQDLEALGVRPGLVVMLHASVGAVGWVVGGPDIVLHALREVLGPEGTLMMYIGWEDNPYEMTSWPEAKRRAYREECPPFDPAKFNAACRSSRSKSFDPDIRWTR